jgi:hypothetical protein
MKMAAAAALLMKALLGDTRGFILHDNSRTRTPHHVQHAIDDNNGVRLWRIPPYSHPTEHLIANIKRQVAEEHTEKAGDLKCSVPEVLNRITVNDCQKLAASMPLRIAAVKISSRIIYAILIGEYALSTIRINII